MIATLKKEFVMIVGTNSETKNEADLMKEVVRLEQIGNTGDFRFHIKEKEEKQ